MNDGACEKTASPLKGSRRRWRIGGAGRSGLGGLRRTSGRVVPVALACTLVAGPLACDDEPARPGSDTRVPLLLVGQLQATDWPSDPVDITDPITRDDTLRMTVTFSGGCREHDFQLIVSTSFLESLPVQARSLLAHDAHGDPCEAVLSREVVVDLSLLKQEWQKAYQATQGTIVLRLEGGPEIHYSFR